MKEHCFIVKCSTLNLVCAVHNGRHLRNKLELDKNNWIKPNDYQKYHVKRGLRNEDGTGVMAGLTRICSVEGYYILDGERIPKDVKLSYRGYDINDIVNGCINEGRFGKYQEVLLLLW